MSTIWELDFYSRPILDENGKKRWEVLICESPTGIAATTRPLFQYAAYCSSSEVNSIWLSSAMAMAMAKSGQAPDRVRFFRQSMNNMITKACSDLNLAAQPSRRTFELSRWVQERMISVYPLEPGYQAGSTAGVAFPNTPPQRLPDALQGQQWKCVSLPAAAFDEMGDWAIDFGESFPLANAAITPETPIPGIIIYSPRAVAMAAWMSGLELAAVKLDLAVTPREVTAKLLLETGVLDRWVLTPLPTQELQQEAERFEALKKAANDVHFIALQVDANVQAFAGFWLLRDVKLI